ncbi:MAG: FAD-dependent oxidoreductase [Gemmatimonadota bacterium]|nr:FAD-dependent oxidoreductase [Gemmatimonadota bacterium]
MSIHEFDYVIVGGGLAGSAAVDGIREMDEDGTIALLTEEETPPYHRPPLSKEYMQTTEAPRDLLYVKPSGWFEDQAGIELVTGARVERLDPTRLVVATEDGEVYSGRRILVSTGGRARALPVEGFGLPGTYTLRTAEDAEAIREAATGAHRVALVGAGFIGMELAATLRKLDLDPIVVDLEERVWGSVFPAPVSSFLQHYFEGRGVRFLLGSAVAAFDGAKRVERVVLADGDELVADLVVVGVGLQPNDQIAREGGLAVTDGVVVDSYCETTAGHIYSAGDVTCYPDPVFGDLVRTEHWDHARAQGRIAGRNMAGAREPYEHVPYFFTHVFDLSINVFGRTGGADRTIVSGELGSGRSVVYCVTEGRLSGAVLINANDAMDECRELIRERPTMDELLDRLGPEGSAEMVNTGAG